MGEHKFKVGDRVCEKADADLDLIGHWDEYWRNTARYDGAFYVTGIIQHSNGGQSVTYSAIPGGEGPQIETKYIEPAPLTIREGHCYRTSDGRKVGPAAGPDGGGDYRVDGDYYNPDGTWIGGDDNCPYDIIAEWTDEPAATNADIFDELEDWMADNPLPEIKSTTGFTVPLDAPEFGGGARFKVGDRVEHIDMKETGTGVITGINNDGTVGVRWNSWHGDCTDPVDVLRLVAEATSGKLEATAPTLDVLYAAECMVKTGVCTINEVRKHLGLGPVPHGHEIALAA